MKGDGTNDAIPLLNNLLEFATPFAQKFAYGGQRDGEAAVIKDGQRNTLLNGSGAPVPAATRNVATNPLDFVFGDPIADATGGNSARSTGLLIRYALIGLAVYFVVKKMG